MESRYPNASDGSEKGGVISSIKASEKSVVIYGCFNADPKPSGWGNCEIRPDCVTLRLSFSKPLRPFFSRHCRPAANSKFKRDSKLVFKGISLSLLAGVQCSSYIHWIRQFTAFFISQVTYIMYVHVGKGLPTYCVTRAVGRQPLAVNDKQSNQSTLIRCKIVLSNVWTF